MKEIVNIIVEKNFTNANFPVFVGHNDTLVNKLHAAKIYVDAIHCDVEVDRLQHENPSNKFVARKVEMTLLDD